MSNAGFNNFLSGPSSSHSYQREDSRAENQYTASASRPAVPPSTSTQQPPSSPSLPKFDKTRWLYPLEANHLLTWHASTPAARRAGAHFYQRLIFCQPFPAPCPHQRFIAVIHPFFARYADDGWSTVLRIKIPKKRSDGGEWEMPVLGSREWRKMGKHFLVQPPAKRVKVLGSGSGNPTDKSTLILCTGSRCSTVWCG